jgi:hypothetical protein
MLNFNWLSGVSAETAKWIFLSLYFLIGIAVMFIPNKFLYEGLTEIRWYHNLKMWTAGLLSFIFVVYYIF